MLRVEFHCHTVYSKDSLASIEAVLDACQRKGIQRLAITDHNTIAGARCARQLDPQRVIIGEEVSTQAGELLAFFVEEEIPPDLPPLDAIARLREQGAFISVSHPFDRFRRGHWLIRDLLMILPHVDAIETFNARCMWPRYNHQAQEFACAHGLSGTVGSDAHAIFEIGRATLYLPDFHDASSLKNALVHARQEVTWSPPWVHLVSRYAVWRKKLQKGLSQNDTKENNIEPHRPQRK